MITSGYSMTSTERVLPRLALDFTTGVLDSRVTVTRALNTATRINSSGLIEGVNANLPRFDYDPATFLPKGLLIEETRINYVLYSEDFTQANWAKGQFGAGVLPIVTPNYATAPNGTNTATRLQLDAGPNTSGDYSLLRQSPLGPGGSVTRSLWAKSNTGTNQVVTFVATTPFAQVTITPTWQRIILPNSTAGSQQFDISVGGDGATPATADITIWGAQHEVGAFATSYIPTTSTSLTRNADDVSMTGTNFSDWYNATEGTFTAEADTLTIDAAKQDYIFHVSRVGGVLNEGIQGGRNAGGTGGQAVTTIWDFSGASNQAVLFTANNVVTVNTPYRFAGAYKLNSYVGSANGGSNLTDNSGTPTSGLDVMAIGRVYSSPIVMNGHIRKLAYYPQRLINAEVQAFSK